MLFRQRPNSVIIPRRVTAVNGQAGVGSRELFGDMVGSDMISTWNPQHNRTDLLLFKAFRTRKPGFVTGCYTLHLAER